MAGLRSPHYNQHTTSLPTKITANCLGERSNVEPATTTRANSDANSRWMANMIAPVGHILRDCPRYYDLFRHRLEKVSPHLSRSKMGISALRFPAGIRRILLPWRTYPKLAYRHVSPNL
jgi:hypothetical protein